MSDKNLDKITSSIRIPEDHLPIMKKILDLDESQKKKIIEKFKNYKPLKFREDPKKVEMFKEFPDIFDLIIILYKLYSKLHEDQIVEDINDFVVDLTNAFLNQIESEGYRDINSKIKLMQQFFIKLLTVDAPIFYFEKTIRLLLERSKLIVNTRIITDIRPVFKEEYVDRPNYSLITHNLRIEYTKDLGNRKRIFFALDHQDLINLQNQIERALEKEDELQKLCQDAGLEIFEV